MEKYIMGGDVFGSIIEKGLFLGKNRKDRVSLNAFTLNGMYMEVIGDGEDCQVFAVGAEGMSINRSNVRPDAYNILYVDHRGQTVVAGLKDMHDDDLEQLVRTVRKSPEPDVLDEDRFSSCVLQEFDGRHRRGNTDRVITVTIETEEDFIL